MIVKRKSYYNILMQMFAFFAMVPLSTNYSVQEPTLNFYHAYHLPYMRDGVSLKTPRPRGWVRAGRPSGGESSFNKRNMYQYPHVSQLFILTSVAKPGIPGAIKNGWVCTADYRMLLGTAVRPVPARMPYISRLCDVGATDVKRWWWWWWWLQI